MRILLIGASGLLGSTILSQRSSITWMPTYLQAPVGHHQAVKLDLTDANALSASVDRFEPEVIVHVAGITKPDACEKDPDLSYRVNVLGTANVVDVAKTHSIRLLFMSSDLVFDGRSESPYSELDSLNPSTVYGRHKVASEEMISTELSDYLIIRTSGMYGWGPLHTRPLAEWVVSALQRGAPVDMFADQFRSLTFAGDVADFLLRMAYDDTTGIVHLASPQCSSKYQFGLEIARVFGFDSQLVKAVNSVDFPRLAKVPDRLALDVAKAQALGAAPRILRDGVTALYSQFLANCHL